MFSDPIENISHMYVAEGMHVADFGAGAGFYTLALADKVGPYGKVYAIDVQTEHLSRIQHEAERRGLKCVELVHGDLEASRGSGLTAGSVDRVIITNILFQTDHPERIAVEAKRIVKRSGKVGVVEWLESFNMMGPHPDHIISEGKVTEMFIAAGLILEEKFDAGTHHYGLLFKSDI